jgi:hypothetical protein
MITASQIMKYVDEYRAPELARARRSPARRGICDMMRVPGAQGSLLDCRGAADHSSAWWMTP